MAESKLEENEVKETKKRGRGRPKKEESINNNVELKKETKKNPKAPNKVKTKPTITEGKGKTIQKETTTKKKSTSTKKAVSKIAEETKTSKAKTTTKTTETTTKTTAKKETVPKKTTKTTKKKVEEPKVVFKEEKKEKEPEIKKDISIDNEKLEKIQKEINKQTKLSKDEKRKINKEIFQNIIMAIVVIVYFMFINLGFYNIEESTYLTDLKVFSLITIGITIILFEKAYKKDSGEITIYGIEMLIITICTFLTNYIYKFHYTKYIYIIASIAMLLAVYYVGKSIVIYVKMKNKALKKASDIHKIVRK